MSSTPREKEKSKVRLRNIFGRFFSGTATSNNNELDGAGVGTLPSSAASIGNANNNNTASNSSASFTGPNEISSPYNAVHRIHVGYDGKKFTGLPQPWLDTLLRDISEADQKKNPSAVVTALKFYAKTVMTQESEKQKFMLTKSQLPSDDDIDDEESSNSHPQRTKTDSLGNSE
ncbi:unnamed protein product [Anisakis simplex]|uniref:CRIB domain-containing protein n=1 Tax=Anisakis simplex TaxID=6269 RepID=A0A0M3K645_ANISI|nr:unnamed protein product [Anisakis simplex]